MRIYPLSSIPWTPTERMTEDSQADIARLNRGLAIRRVKKRTNIMNDKRIKISCISRHDSGIHASAVLARCQGGHMAIYFSQGVCSRVLHF